MVEIRTISYLLHPPLLDGIGLEMALRTYLEGFSKRTGIRVQLDVPEDTGRRMPSPVELVLFRVIQEALTNVWRHSGSQTARIALAQQPSVDGNQVTLSIEDSVKASLAASRVNAREHKSAARRIHGSGPCGYARTSSSDWRIAGD
jgi:signal transduction histidine kinase